MYEALIRSVEQTADTIAYDYLDYQSTCATFSRDIDRCAKALAAHGLKSGMMMTIAWPTIPQGIIRRKKPTAISGVPTLYDALSRSPILEDADLSCLLSASVGADTLPSTVKERFEDVVRRCGGSVQLVEGYGLTEASPICTITRLEQENKPGAIGTPIGGVEARIIADDNTDVPRGETGELIVRGKNVMKGYYKDERATAEVIRDGWLHTGDLGRMDADGYIFLTGRKKRMVITSGFNVYPREVEIVLEMHPAVAAARVESKEDLMRGEIVKALIVRKPGAEADDRI